MDRNTHKHMHTHNHIHSHKYTKYKHKHRHTHTHAQTATQNDVIYKRSAVELQPCVEVKLCVSMPVWNSFYLIFYIREIKETSSS